MGPGDSNVSGDGLTSSTNTMFVFDGKGPSLWEEWLESVRMYLDTPGSGIKHKLFEWEEGTDVVDDEELSVDSAEKISDEYYWYRTQSVSEVRRKMMTSIKSVQNYMLKDRTDLYKLMFKYTADDTRNEVRTLGKEQIHQVRSLFQRYYGKKADARRIRLELLISRGFSNEEEIALDDDGDLVKHFQGFETIHRELLRLIPKSNRASYSYAKPVEKSKCLAIGLPQKYLTQLQVIKMITANKGTSGESSDTKTAIVRAPAVV
jgi:hypothetical protein